MSKFHIGISHRAVYLASVFADTLNGREWRVEIRNIEWKCLLLLEVTRRTENVKILFNHDFEIFTCVKKLHVLSIFEL